MAKNRKKKPGEKNEAEAPSTSAAPSAAVTGPKTPADLAFAAGNYSAIHSLAKHGDAKAKELLPLTTIDMGQIACGIVAFVVVVTIMIFTLHAH